MLARPLLTGSDKGADGGGRSVKDIHLIFIDDTPEAIPLWPVGCALIHQTGGAVRQRAVDDVTMAGDPTDIGRAPIRIFLLQVEHILGGEVGAEHIATGGVHNTLRPAGGAAGIENVQWMLGVEGFGWALLRGVGHQFMPPVIASRLHVYLAAGAPIDDDMLDARRLLNGVINGLFEWDLAAASIAPVG